MAFNLDGFTELTQITTRQDTALGLMRWGNSNSFPQTLKNIVEQSPLAKAAVDRTATFFKGGSFEGEDTIVNPNGLTLRQLVDTLADELALFGGLSYHCNFNIKGKVTSLSPISITDGRFKGLDELYYSSKVGYHPNFGKNDNVVKTIQNHPTADKILFHNRFNPNTVLEEIQKAGGTGKYKGQLLYYSNSGFSSYPIPPLQSAINYVLSDVENSIMVRKETATGFLNSYILKTSLSSDDPNLVAFEAALNEAQGSRGKGKIITFSGLPPEDLSCIILEEIGAGASGTATSIKASADAMQLSRAIIQGAYLIPPILGGGDQSTGFTTSELEDAYFVFNAITQNGRKIISKQVSLALENSEFQIKEINIPKLKLDKEEKEE